jgi:hypothetical protein
VHTRNSEQAAAEGDRVEEGLEEGDEGQVGLQARCLPIDGDLHGEFFFIESSAGVLANLLHSRQQKRQISHCRENICKSVSLVCPLLQIA